MSIKMMGDFEHPVGKLIKTGSCPFEIQNKTIIRQDISPQETTFNFPVKVYIKHHVSVNFIKKLACALNGFCSCSCSWFPVLVVPSFPESHATYGCCCLKTEQFRHLSLTSCQYILFVFKQGTSTSISIIFFSWYPDLKLSPAFRDQEQGLHFNPVIFAALTRNLFISVFLCAENAFNDFRYR